MPKTRFLGYKSSVLVFGFSGTLFFEGVGRASLHIFAFSPRNEHLVLWFELQRVESYDIHIKQHEKFPLIKHGI